MQLKRSSIFSLALLCIALFFLSACNDGNEGNKEVVQASGIPHIDNITAAIQSDPDNATLYFQRGQAYYEEQGYDEAIADLNRAVSLDSTNIDYYHLLADTYMDYYRSKKALATMYTAAEIAPQRIPTLLKLSEFEFILKQYKAASRTIDRILTIDPLNAEAFFMKGVIYRDQGQLEEAVRSFQTAVESDAELVDGWLMLGELHSEKDFDQALLYFDNALLIDSLNITALHSKAFFLQNNDRIPDALGIYRKINKIDPQYSDAFFNAGILYFEIDSLNRAFEQFDITVNIEPTRALAYYYRGMVSNDLGNVDAAINDLQQCLTLDPENNRAREALQALKS